MSSVASRGRLVVPFEAGPDGSLLKIADSISWVCKYTAAELTETPFAWVKAICDKDRDWIIGRFRACCETFEVFDEYYGLEGRDGIVMVHGRLTPRWAGETIEAWDGIVELCGVAENGLHRASMPGKLRGLVQYDTCTENNTEGGMSPGTRHVAGVNGHGSLTTERAMTKHVYLIQADSAEHAYAGKNLSDATDYAERWNRIEREDPTGMVAVVDIDGTMHQKCTNSVDFVHHMGSSER